MTSDQNMPRCGLIMPMSAWDSCPETHWDDVRDILTAAIEDAGFEANLVSDADDVGVIQKRIIQNVYENPIVVCDVSGKNPNVMFELGMRLAFDKPVVIVKDDKTSYTFDTSPIEHLGYPRDLRFNQIVQFKSDLTEKLQGTYVRATKDADFTPFLKHFGKFTVAKLDTKEIPTSEYILEELKAMRKSMADLSGAIQRGGAEPTGVRSRVLCVHCGREPSEMVAQALSTIGQFTMEQKGADHFHFTPAAPDGIDWDKVLELSRHFAPNAQFLPRRLRR